MKVRSVKSVRDLRMTWFMCESLGIKDSIEIPIRKNGLTGSGEISECHGNVDLLVRTYGGKSVLGFSYEIHEDFIKFYSHTVWETPEGKIVDVTYHHRECDTFDFLPIVKYNPKVEYYTTPPNVIFKSGKIILSETGDLYGKCFSRKDFKKNKKKIKSHLMEKRNFPSPLDMGGFSKPSTSTGKYFEMR